MFKVPFRGTPASSTSVGDTLKSSFRKDTEQDKSTTGLLFKKMP